MHTTPKKTVSLIRKLTTHLPYCCHRDQQSKHHEGPNAKHLRAGRLRGYSKHLLNTSTRLRGHRGRLQCTQPLWLDPHPGLHPGNLMWYWLALCYMFSHNEVFTFLLPSNLSTFCRIQFPREVSSIWWHKKLSWRWMCWRNFKAVEVREVAITTTMRISSSAELGATSQLIPSQQVCLLDFRLNVDTSME